MLSPSSRTFRVLFWVATLASVVPLLATRYLPFTDLPEHVAAIATLDRLLRGAGDGTYAIALGQSQYLLYDVVGALLTRVVGDAQLANRLLLAFVAMLWPVSLRALLGALGRDRRAALFAPMVFWNRAVVLGFLPFVGSVPLCLFGLALVVRQCREPRPARAVGLAFLAVALFYTHVSAWVLFVAVATLLFAIATLPELRPRRIAETLAPFVPSGLCALAWWRAGSLTASRPSAPPIRMPLTENLGALPIWTFDVWRTHVDEVCAIAWWAAVAMVIVKSAPPRPLFPQALRSRLFVAAPLCAALAVYFATPFGIGTAAYLNVRLAPLVTLALLVLLRPREDAWGTAPLLVAFAATLANAADATYEVRRASAEMLGDFDGLLAAITPGSRLVSLNFDVRSARVHYFPSYFIDVRDPVFAKDGATVFYTFGESNRGFGGTRTWSVSAAGGGLPTLVEPDAPCSDVGLASVSPADGTLVLVQSTCQSADAAGLFAYGGMGAPVRVLGTGGASVVSPVGWAPDGSGFVLAASDVNGVGSLLLYDAESGAAPITIVQGTRDVAYVRGGAIAPDGKIVYCVQTASGTDLHLLDTTVSPVTDTPITTDGKSCYPRF